MSKLPSNSRVGQLTPDQRAILDFWLFEKNISYIEAATRVKDQFHVFVTDYNMFKYHERRQGSYGRECIMRASNAANTELRAAAKNDKNYLKELLNLLGQVVFERALGSQSQADLQEVRDSLRVLIAAKHEGHAADRVALQREKWEFDVSRACVAHLAELQVILANQSLDELGRLQAVRKSLFGEKLTEEPPEQAPSLPAENADDAEKKPN